MRFIRENLFLIVTIAIVVVLGGLLLGLAHSVGAQVDESAQLRIDRSQKMRGLESAGVNEAVVQVAERRVELMNESAARVAEYCLNRNRGVYRIITFDIAGKSVKAFPVNKELYRQEALRWRFPQQYRKELLNVLNSLQPTRPPTEEEIRDEEDRIAQRETPLDRTGGLTGPRPGMRPWSGRTEPAAPRGRTLDYGYGPMQPGVPAPTTQPGEEIEPAGPTPAERATRNLIWAKSQQGWVYADELNLHTQLVTTDASSDYADDALWMAQVGLWVQKDIAEVINRTNREAQQNAPVDKTKGVASSAIKRLVNVNIRGYVVKAATTVSLAPGREPAAASEAAPAALSYVPGVGASSGYPPKLTGRSCNKLYDVVHYDFTVILPARYLRRLYENLRLQNFHTVLDVKISMPGGDSGMSPAAQSRAGESYYYYGTDPVVQAKITGELLLLTDWTRGRWDAVKKEWDKDYPPLMPEQFLKWIARDASVLRQEDQTRAPAAATPTMSPMAMPQPARAPAPLNIPRGRTRE